MSEEAEEPAPEPEPSDAGTIAQVASQIVEEGVDEEGVDEEPSDRAAASMPDSDRGTAPVEDGVSAPVEGEEPAHRGAKNQQSARPRRDAPSSAKDQVSAASQTFYQSFNGPLYAPGGKFGSQNGEPADGWRRKATGKLTDADIARITRGYAAPPGFEDACGALTNDHIVVIEGRHGDGRRAGAVALLRQVTRGQLVVLSPVVTLRDLVERAYSAGYGYLVVDRKAEANAADVDFTWSNVCSRVRESGAYLVVTSVAAAGRAATRAVQHVTWRRPSVTDALRAQLIGHGYRGTDLDDLVVGLVDELPVGCALERLAELARLVSGGTSPDAALDQLNRTAGDEVRRWFAERPRPRQIEEVAALSFLVGTDVRTFELLLGEFSAAVARHIPPKRGKGSARDHEARGDRSEWSAGTGLIAFEYLPVGASSTQTMVFKDQAQQRYVLGELWDTKPGEFWDAVRDWLYAIVQAGDSMEVASGLAWLACANSDEVEDSYLEPWSLGQLGWQGQVTATYVLWYLCRVEHLAALALQTAVRWAGARSVHQRWTAVVAFSGELGICYPTEATNRLWQLMTQSHDLREPGCSALACLFVTLADETSDAGIVLTLLHRKIETFGDHSDGHGGDNRTWIRDITMAVALLVLSMPSVRYGRSAVFEFLHRNPGRVEMVAQIWARLILYRPHRREALIALRRGLHALRDIHPEDPSDDARRLGEALSAALPPREHQPFKDHFMQIDEQLRKGLSSPADVLIACLDAISLRTSSKEYNDDGVSDHRSAHS